MDSKPSARTPGACVFEVFSLRLPEFTVETAVLHRFGDVRNVYLFIPRKVSDGACDTQNLIIRPRRKAETFKHLL